MLLHQLDKRSRKMLSVLRSFTTISTSPVDGIEIAPRGTEDFVPFENGGIWATTPETEWQDFRFRFTVPDTMKGLVRLRLITGHENEWEAKGPQIVIWIDGVLRQAFDTQHRYINIGADEAGKTYEVFLQAYAEHANGIKAPNHLYLELAEINNELEQLIYDLEVPYQAAILMPDGNREAEMTLETISRAFDLLDLRDPQSDEFNASVAAARAYFKTEFYDKRKSLEPEAIADCIGHTHIDVAWLWDIHQSRSKAVRSFATMLEQMDRYPEFKFMSSQPVLYKFVKEDAPQLFERLKKAVARGQWIPEGAMWVEADCNISGGESLVRQILYGQKFFNTEFGKKSRVLWLPDVFGYSAALPQILKKSGVDYFMTSKLSWSEFNKTPYDTFMWKGVDGTEVLTHFTPSRAYTNSNIGDLQYFTTYNAMLNPSEMKGGWERFQQKGVDNHFLVSYGFGDGGGGTCDWMIENARRMKDPLPGVPAVRQTSPTDFFTGLEERVKDRADLPKWSGELYLEYHRGTYTAMARNKRYNRKFEIKLREVELWRSMAEKYCGLAYPAEELNGMWEDMLTLQFHDILPGSSIKKVYEDSKEDYERLFPQADKLLTEAVNAIAAKTKADVVAFNSLGFFRDDVICFDGPEGVTCLKNKNGDVFPAQKTETGRYAAFVTDLDPMSVTPLFFGYEDTEAEGVTATRKRFETPFFKGTFDEAMRITSLVDKRNGRELCKPGEKLNRIVCYENRPHDYDAWDINIYYNRRNWEVDNVTSVKVISHGPVFTKLRVTYKFMNSEIRQNLVFYKDLDRIDFETDADFVEKHLMLKTHFPVDIFYNKATYDIQYGNVERATHKNTSWDVARFECCAHKWADVSEAGYGFTVMNDCKYGHSVDENSIALTMLKTSTDPNPDADQGFHQFTYSVMPHIGDWRVAAVPQMAYMLNMPVLTAAGGNGRTKIDAFAVPDAENVLVESVKKPLAGEGTIVRMYECYGMRTETVLFVGKAKRVTLVNLMEDEESEMKIRNGAVEIAFKPYEIVSVKVEY